MIKDLAANIKQAHEEIQNYIKNGCKGDLELYQIDFVPDTLTHVRGYFSLQETFVNKLPDNLTIEGDLNLWCCLRLKVLPKGLKVGGVLMIEETGITSIEQLPIDLEVGGEIMSDVFSDKEAKDRLNLLKKLPELEGIF